jgi:hypothetical protein
MAMIRHPFPFALVIVSTILIAPPMVGQVPATEALFNLHSPSAGPFPSDWFTEPDHTQKTHRRVSLPLPDCQVYVSDCEDLAVLNELDGFNLQPRLSVPFSGPIDVNTVTSDALFLVSLGITGPGQDYMPWGTVVGIDRVVWDTFTNTLHVESDAALAQHTRFALIVTRGVRDQSGAPVAASEAFRRFRTNVREDYKEALLDAIQAARHIGVPEKDVAVASVFTTRSATAVLEKVRDQIHAALPDAADFLVGSNGERTVFSLGEVTGITWRRQTRVNPPAFTSTPIDFSVIRTTFPGAVGSVAFGKFFSPDYEVHPGEYMPPVGTRSGTPAVQGTNEIYFDLFLPFGPKPTNGWPVAILGRGAGQSKNGPGSVVSSMAAHGIATVIINAVGHGSGPLGTLTVSRTVGVPATFSAGGRGIDQNGDGVIGNDEGISAALPRGIVLYSDGFRQTAVDLMQLVRVIEVGMDVDGDTQSDLDSSRIYYIGMSLGGGYGTVFLPVEPNVRAGVLVVPADPPALGSYSLRRSILGSILDARQPSLINSPGITFFGGPTVNPPFFDENLPLRDQTLLTVRLADLTTRDILSPVINGVGGAMAIQEALENVEWVSQAGSPVAYATHLQRAPLSGVPAKPVIYQIAKGDQTAINPATTAILRAGELKDRTLYYRHDLARLDFPTLPTNPHGFAGDLTTYGAIALGAQGQAATFFASDGVVAIQPTPMRYFEFPIIGPLPEALNFVP